MTDTDFAANASIFRHRPTIVEARQIHATDWDNVEAIAEWCGGDPVQLEDFLKGRDTAVIFVPDREDETVGSYAEDSDWIVRFPDGTCDVYADEAFHAAYTPVVGS